MPRRLQPIPQRRCQRLGNFRLRLNDFSLHFLRISTHFLFFGHSHRTAFFRFRLGNSLIRFRLIGLQLSADVSSYIHIGDINGQDLKGGTGIQSFSKYRARNMIRIG